MLERIFQEPKFRVCCLGAIKLVETGSGTDMTPTSRKARALIGYLCIAGKPVRRERLASLLWGDRGEDQARASLRQAIYELRSVPGGDRLLKVERDTVAVGEDVATDVAEIMAAARSGDLEQLSQALLAWRGDFFEDLLSVDPSFDAWLQAERLRVQESLIDAAAEAVKAGIAHGEIGAARKVVGLLQQHDGTNEVVLRLGLRLDHLAGDSAALHRRYERFREQLRSELDAAPAAETQFMFDELAAKLRAPTVPACSNDQAAEGGGRSDEPRSATSDWRALKETPAKSDIEAVISSSALHSRRRISIVPVTVGAAFVCALAWVIWNLSHEGVPHRQAPLLAVMSFQSLSADTASRAFCGTISKEIADALLHTNKIRLAFASSSVTSVSAPPLPATHVLSGSVERVGDRFHVVAQLMDIRNDRVIWARAYDQTVVQTPAPRNEVAVQIAGALTWLLSSGTFDEAEHTGSTAYDHYLTGRRLLLQNFPRAAAAELEASIRRAPNFAKAWSSLATARLLLATDTLGEHEEEYVPPVAEAARAAARRALTLDPNNGEALGVLAMLIPPAHLEEIERQLERALRAEPYNAQLLGWRGAFLMFVGRNREALDVLTRAYVLDRAAPSVVPNLVLASLKSGRFEQASEILGLLDRDRDDRLRSELLDLRIKYFLYRLDWFGMATWLSVLPGQLSPPMTIYLRLCRETAAALATRDADKFGRLRASWRAEISNPDDAVQFLSALADADGALAVIQTAIRSRRHSDLLTDPQWEALFVPDLVPLRRDPRVPALLAQWGLSDYWRTSDHSPDFMR